jgi:hypothetical protein
MVWMRDYVIDLNDDWRMNWPATKMQKSQLNALKSRTMMAIQKVRIKVEHFVFDDKLF